MERPSWHWAAALALELAPAAVLNFAVAFAVASLFRQAGLAAVAAPASIAAGIAAFLIAWQCLRTTGSSRRSYSIPAFDHLPVEVEPGEQDVVDELLLTDVVASDAAGQQNADDELLLDDILESIAPDSRVVRLFDPASIPTAGELRARIDRHLGSQPAFAPPDATAELHEALSALRQSLR